MRELVQKAWAEDAAHTVQILMHGRDCRGGKGERQVVLHGLMWLRENKPATYLLNLARFLNLGCELCLLSSVKLMCAVSSQITRIC